MNFIHQSRTHSIFRELSRGVAFSILATALCSECFGAIQDYSSSKNQKGTTIDLTEGVRYVVNITRHLQGARKCKLEDKENWQDLIYNISPEKGDDRINVFYPFPKTHEPWIEVRADDGEYQIDLEKVNSPVMLSLAPTQYIGLFYDEDLITEKNKLPFGFYSDFSIEANAGRNITFFRKVTDPCILSDASSIFRLTDTGLDQFSVFPRANESLPRSIRSQHVKQYKNFSVETKRREAAKAYYKNNEGKIDSSLTKSFFDLYNAFNNGEIKKAEEILLSAKILPASSEKKLSKKTLNAIQKDLDKIPEVLQNKLKKALYKDCFAYLYWAIKTVISKGSATSLNDCICLIDVVKLIDVYTTNKGAGQKAFEEWKKYINTTPESSERIKDAQERIKDAQERIKDAHDMLLEYLNENPFDDKQATEDLLRDLSSAITNMLDIDRLFIDDQRQGSFRLWIIKYLESGAEDKAIAKTIEFITKSLEDEYRRQECNEYIDALLESTEKFYNQGENADDEQINVAYKKLEEAAQKIKSRKEQEVLESFLRDYKTALEDKEEVWTPESVEKIIKGAKAKYNKLFGK